jgi:hypothetical protein
MSGRTLKKLLLSFILIGALASITTGGTYAVLRSDTGNTAGAIASATLTMGNTAGATTCNSKDGTANSITSGCGVLFTTSALQYPGLLAKANVQVTNTGSAPGYDLGLSMPGATSGAGCAKSDNATVGAVLGGGDPCSATGDLFYVQETQSDFTTPVHCWYPAGGTTCSISGGGTLNGFATTYYYDPGVNLASKLDLGLDSTSTTRYALPATSGQTGSSRYFVIGVQENGTNNALQGETATFSLLWHLDSGP